MLRGREAYWHERGYISLRHGEMLTGMSIATICRAARLGDLKFVREGKRRYYDIFSIAKWVGPDSCASTGLDAYIAKHGDEWKSMRRTRGAA